MLQLSELLNDPLADPINIATEITAATTAALCVVSVISGEGIPPVKKKRVEEEKSTTFHLLSDPEFVNRFRMKRSTVNVSESIVNVSFHALISCQQPCFQFQLVNLLKIM